MSVSSNNSNGRPLSQGHDTGFPESLAARTTSWRHPEANTAPGACISAHDIDPARALHRHRRSFLHDKYRRTTSHGFITSEMEQEFANSQEALGWCEESANSSHGNINRTSKDGTDSYSRTDDSTKDDHSPISPTSTQFEHKMDSPRRRSGLFKLLRLHRH